MKNHPVQGSAATVFKVAGNRLDQRGDQGARCPRQRQRGQVARGHEPERER